MNWIIWMVLAVILIGVLVGLYRGALRIMVSIVTMALTLVVTFFATPFVANIVMEKTPLDDSIKKYVVNSMEEAADSLVDTNAEEQESTEEEDEVVEEILENKEIPRDIQIQVIEESEFPESFKNLLKENNNDEIYRDLGVETFAQYVGAYLAKLMIHVATFLGLLLIVTIVFRALVFALNIVNDIPVFGFVNRLAGGALGLICSLMIIWFFFALVTLFYTTNIGRAVYEVVVGNDYMRIIYENNPLFNLSMKF